MLPKSQTPNTKRGKNFSAAEDRQLCLSWIAVSEDPIKGTDQTLTVFWGAVKEHGKFELRQADGLRQRWGLVSRAVAKFVGCYNSVLLLHQSGTTPEDTLEKALTIYKTEQKDEFKFLECWEVLKSYPKFSSNANRGSAAGNNSQVCTPPLMLDTPSTARPVGRNTTKAVLLNSQLETRRVEALERIAAAAEEKTRLLKEYNETLSEANIVKIITQPLEGLDATSLELLNLKKQQLLTKMLAERQKDEGNDENLAENDVIEFLYEEDEQMSEHTLEDILRG